MRWFEAFPRSLERWFRRPDEEDMGDEIRFHIEMETQENLRRGMSAGEARRAAEAAFGRVENVKDHVRDVRPMARFLGDVAHDARVAIRSLPKQAGYALAVVLVLAIGIGGNIAMVGVLESVLWSSLPYPDSDELVLGRVTYEGNVGNTVSGPDFYDYRESVQSLDGLAAITPFPLYSVLTGGEAAERIRTPRVSAGFFDVLGARMSMGRGFSEVEGSPGGPPVAVVSYDFWQRRLGGDQDVLGRTVVLDGIARTVVGVAPAGFRLLVDADAWLPVQRGEGLASARQFHNFVLVGRLADGTPLSTARAEVETVSGRLEQAYPDTNENKGLDLTPLREALGQSYRQPVLLLAAGVALLLLVACANIAGLLVARGTARRGEFAVRSALGAGSGRLARQLLTENAILGLVAMVLALLVATFIQRGILVFLPSGALGELGAGLSPLMALSALLIAGATLLLSGVFPALRVSRSDPASALRDGRRSSGSQGSARSHGFMVVAQVSISAVLLVLTGLLVRSFQELRAVDVGFDSRGLLTADIGLPAGEYADTQRRRAFYEELGARLAAMPGVTGVGFIDRLPLRDGGANVRIAPPEEWGSGGVFERIAYRRSVMPGYFDAMNIPLLGGRDVSLRDDSGSDDVVVIEQGLAEDMFGDQMAIGRLVGIDVGEDEPHLLRVIGVVGDVQTSSLAGTGPSMYLPYGQSSPATMRVALRTDGEAGALVGGLREAVAAIDRDVPLSGVQTMEAVIDASVSGPRSMAVLLGSFALIAIALTTVGIYGLLAYRVSRRVPEIGVRMALGASMTHVAVNVLRGGLKLVVIGLVVALPVAALSTRWVQNMLFQVGSVDLPTYLMVVGLTLLVAVLACLIPARRAARVDPARAFRAE